MIAGILSFKGIEVHSTVGKTIILLLKCCVSYIIDWLGIRYRSYSGRLMMHKRRDYRKRCYE